MSAPLPRNARPFLKWAGGKQQLLPQYEPFFPATFTRYIEPFTGGGAVFFHLWNTGRLPGAAFLFDHNEELVNAYRQVRDCLPGLLDLLAEHKRLHSPAHYYAVRGLDRQSAPLNPLERAARTIYLNKTCYNGLFRVNRKGQFNVPLGSYINPGIYDPENLRAASYALQGVALEVMDFRSLPSFARPHDLFYFDPPYAPLSKTASFTGYTSGSFGEADQRELAQVFAALSNMGCLCMLSNSYTPLVLELYQDFRIENVEAGRAINSKADRRGSVKEVLVMNFAPG